MRKVIAVVILLALGALLIWNPSIYKKKKADTEARLLDGRIEEEEILPLAKIKSDTLTFNVEELQRTPDKIMLFNSMLMKVMYAGGETGNVLSDEDIKVLAKVQRRYFHKDLLDVNTEAAHLAAIIKEVHKARDGESWIVGYEVQGTEYSPTETNIALVTVRFMPNSVGESIDIYQRYILERNEAGLWFIKGWEGLDANEVVVMN